MLALLVAAAVPRLLPEPIAPRHALRGIRPLAVVLGCDEVASAIAHRLHGDGFGVVLIADVDPSAPRRGMSFTDAWYVGAADLAGSRAIFCASIRSIPAVLHQREAIAATTWSWGGVAAALAPVVTVDTRAASRRTRLDRSISPAMLTIEIVPGAVTGPEFDVAIASRPAVRSDARAPLHAPESGRFSTLHGIGDWLSSGDAVGVVGRARLVAPCEGRLTALSARGARVQAGDLVCEIDRHATDRQCFGLDPDAVTVAEAVSRAVEAERLAPSAAMRPRYSR